MNISPLQQSLPRNPGAQNIQPTYNRKLYHKDPKFDIFKTPKTHFKKILTEKKRYITEDSFNIAYQPPIVPIVADMYDNRTRINIYRNEWYEPLPIARQTPAPVPVLTNAQADILSRVDDPVRKYFLLEMFKGKIQMTTSIKGKLAGITPADGNILDQSLNRLLQQYTGLSNMNNLNDASLKKLLDDYYSEIRPIYEKWKLANPGAVFDPIQELTTGLSNMIPAPVPIPPLAIAPPAVIGGLIPSIAPVAPVAPVGGPVAPVAPVVPVAPIAPVGGPVAQVQTASDILIQDTLDIFAKLGASVTARNDADIEKYFGELHQKIITMTPIELDEFNMLSNDILKKSQFVQDYVTFLTDNKQMTTSDIRDIYGSSLPLGAVNILDAFVAGSSTPSPTPAPTSLSQMASESEMNRIVGNNPDIKRGDLIRLINIVYPLALPTDKESVKETKDFAKIRKGKKFSYLRQLQSKADIYRRIISVPPSSIYKALSHFAFIFNLEIVGGQSTKYSIPQALTSVLNKEQVGYGKKKKGINTIAPKQYKTGGKQKTAREQQLARLIKLL